MTGLSDAQTREDVAAIIACITHKMSVELGAEVIRVPGAVGLRYRQALSHPWPRAVELNVDILAEDVAGAIEARSKILTDPRETHRTSVFGWDVARNAEAIAATGYDGCWNTALLAADLADAPRTPVPDPRIERVERVDQIAELNALASEFPSYPASLGMPEFIDLFGRREGEAVAKGQVVLAAGATAYIADMFTRPDARERGYAGAILSALHGQATSRGAKRTVLIPSLATVESGFYLKRGYRQVCGRAVLLSKA